MPSDTFLAPPDHPRRPQHLPPVGATDCHAHVFGPFDRFPLAPERHYTPSELSGERYLRMLDDIGFSRGVLVQATAHGTDCGALLHALDRGGDRLRGIALLAPDVSDEDLWAMHRRGVRGARFSRPPGELTQGSIGFEVLESLAPRLAGLGWHAQIWTPCGFLASAAPRLTTLGVPLVVDHMGYFDVSRGVTDPSFQVLLRLLGEGRIWVKLGSFRLSKRYPDYEDVAPFHRALVAVNPERLLWGSDWPHVSMRADMPDVGHLVDLFDRWTGDEALRRRILVDNPARLYGFLNQSSVLDNPAAKEPAS
jgi:predicted TIM-barrel fold metal-dependent hydrolase